MICTMITYSVKKITNVSHRQYYLVAQGQGQIYMGEDMTKGTLWLT